MELYKINGFIKIEGFVKYFVCKARKPGKGEAYFLYVEAFSGEAQRSRRTLYETFKKFGGKIMGIPMGSEEWALALKDEVNKSDGYRMASLTWEDDFYFIVTKGGLITEDICVYLDLWHGECREAFSVIKHGVKSPSFEISAPLDIWKKVASRELNPIKGIMTRQLKIKGNILKLIKAPKSAVELVECAIRLDTEWP